MTEPMYQIRAEEPNDFSGINYLYNATLGDGEAELVNQLRQDQAFHPRLSLVASADAIVLGHILFSDLKLAGRNGNKIKGAALAPMAVLPACQQMGIGTALVEEGLKILQELDYAIAVVLGDPKYYQRFGFSLELGQKIQCPYSGRHLLAKELKDGALINEKKVAAIYPKAFSSLS